MKILFLSKDNLTTNPRLLKELKTAAEFGLMFRLKQLITTPEFRKHFVFLQQI